MAPTRPTTARSSAANRGPAGGRPRARRLGSGEAIQAASAKLFLARGYQGTSMDDIAAEARVSKQTIYTHFADKEALFAALVMANADRVDAFLERVPGLVRGAPTLTQGLTDLAAAYLAVVIQPDVLRLRRLILAEAGRFPGLARDYYERVPARMYRTLATLFESLAAECALHLRYAAQAAEHFAWLVLGAPLDRGMFCETGPDDLVRPTAAADAVRVFLAAYGR